MKIQNAIAVCCIIFCQFVVAQTQSNESTIPTPNLITQSDANRTRLADASAERGKAIAQADSNGASCSVAAFASCPACAISCPTGQAAICQGGSVSSVSGSCWVQPACYCSGFKVTTKKKK